LTDRDRWICAQLKQTLLDNGIIFVGIDVIGDYLTEINITSPTCIRQLDTLYNLNISAVLFDAIEDMLEA
jgi:glutathione synthase